MALSFHDRVARLRANECTTLYLLPDPKHCPDHGEPGAVLRSEFENATKLVNYNGIVLEEGSTELTIPSDMCRAELTFIEVNLKRRAPNLSKVTVQNLKHADLVPLLFDALQGHADTIRELVLEELDSTDELITSVTAFLKACRRLKSVTLNRIVNNNPGYQARITEALFSNPCVLSRLEWRNESFFPDGITELANAIGRYGKLTALLLPNAHIPPEKWIALANVFPKPQPSVCPMLYMYLRELHVHSSSSSGTGKCAWLAEVGKTYTMTKEGDSTEASVLETLVLKGVNFDTASFEGFIQWISRVTNLKNLTLMCGYAGIKGEQMEIFARTIRQHPSLETLHLSGIRTKDSDYSELYKACGESATLSSLTVKDIIYEAEMPAICSMIRTTKSLKTVDLAGTSPSLNYTPILLAIHDNNSIESLTQLNLKKTPPSIAIVDAMHNNSSLQSLNKVCVKDTSKLTWDDNKLETCEAMCPGFLISRFSPDFRFEKKCQHDGDFCDVLYASLHPRYHLIDLTLTAPVAKTLDAMTQSIGCHGARLERFVIERCTASSKLMTSLRTLTAALKDVITLKEIRYDEMEYDDHSNFSPMVEFAAVIETLPALERVSISGMNPDGCRAGTIGADYLCQDEIRLVGLAIGKCPTLQEFRIELVSLRREDVKFIADGIRRNSNLCKLELISCSLTDASLRRLCDGMVEQASITHLNLSNNAFGEVGMRYLSNTLDSGWPLQELILSKDNLTGVSFVALCSSLRFHEHLTHLDVSSNDPGPTGLNELAELIKHNRVLTHIVMDFCGLDENGSDLVADALSESTTLKYFSVQCNTEELIADYLSSGGRSSKVVDLKRRNRAITESFLGALRQNTTLETFRGINIAKECRFHPRVRHDPDNLRALEYVQDQARYWEKKRGPGHFVTFDDDDQEHTDGAGMEATKSDAVITDIRPGQVSVGRLSTVSEDGTTSEELTEGSSITDSQYNSVSSSNGTGARRSSASNMEAFQLPSDISRWTPGQVKTWLQSIGVQSKRVFANFGTTRGRDLLAYSQTEFRTLAGLAEGIRIYNALQVMRAHGSTESALVSDETLVLGTDVAKAYDLDGELSVSPTKRLYYATHKVTGQKVILKYIAGRDAMDHELAILKRFPGTVITLVDAIVNAVVSGGVEYHCIVMVRASWTLRDKLRNGFQRAEERMSALLDVVEALSVLHKSGYVHGDIKPENIGCVQTATSLRYVLLDVGGTIQVGHKTTTYSAGYASPEQARAALSKEGTTATTAQDIWSLGIVAYEIWTGRNPYVDIALATPGMSDASPQNILSEALLRANASRSAYDQIRFDEFGTSLQDHRVAMLLRQHALAWDPAQRVNIAAVVGFLKGGQSTKDISLVKYSIPEVCQLPLELRVDAQWTPYETGGDGNGTYFLYRVTENSQGAARAEYDRVRSMVDASLPGPFKIDITKMDILRSSTLEGRFASTYQNQGVRAANDAFGAKWQTAVDAEAKEQLVDQFSEAGRHVRAISDAFPTLVVPAFHGTDHETVPSICESGFANLSKKNTGFFGNGVYFTLDSQYACHYATPVPHLAPEHQSVYPNEDGEFVMILSWVNLGNTYPVTRDSDYTVGVKEAGRSDAEMCASDPMLALRASDLYGHPLQSGYSSHCVAINRAEPTAYQACRDVNRCDARELVVREESQALPRYIIYFKIHNLEGRSGLSRSTSVSGRSDNSAGRPIGRGSEAGVTLDSNGHGVRAGLSKKGNKDGNSASASAAHANGSGGSASGAAAAPAPSVLPVKGRIMTVPHRYVPNCPACDKPFNALYRRRHHCRICQGYICAKDSKTSWIDRNGVKQGVRVCLSCLEKHHLKSDS